MRERGPPAPAREKRFYAAATVTISSSVQSAFRRRSAEYYVSVVFSHTTDMTMSHHNHFAHHVRTTKHWGFEPGWKFVSYTATEDPSSYHRKHSSNGSNRSSRRDVIDYYNPSYATNGVSNNTKEYNSNSNNPDPFAGRRGGSFRSSLGHGNPFRSASSSSVGYNNARPIPTKNNVEDSFYFRPIRSSSSGGGGTLPRSANKHLYDSRGSYKGYSYESSAGLPSSGSSSVSSSPTVPETVVPMARPGVLKKPGANRGARKSMKKVAFLENAEFSRGSP